MAVTVTMAFDKETKGTKRFVELHDDGDFAQIGTLYVPKPTLRGLGDPETLTVTLS